MNSRRELKKYVHIVCGALAASILETSYEFNEIKGEKVHHILEEIAALQTSTLSRLNVNYEMTSNDMAPAQYRKARRKFYRQMFTSLMSEFDKCVGDIVKQINDSIPEHVREALKSAGAE